MFYVTPFYVVLNNYDLYYRHDEVINLQLEYTHNMKRTKLYRTILSYYCVSL